MIIQRKVPVKRCAILIGNDRWGGKFLPGVSKDIEALKQFILSPEGGSWNETEILELNSPHQAEYFFDILSEVAQKSEYVFIYFAGHGELSCYLTPSFVFPGNAEISLDDIKQIFQNKPVLMISDSCQGIPEYKQGGRITESLRMFSTGDPVKEFKARRTFDKELRVLPPMFTYASAVSPGQSAKEGSEGGYYTQNLLKACKFILDNSEIESGVYGICDPHHIASQAVETVTCRAQRPRIGGYTRTFQPPFLVKL